MAWIVTHATPAEGSISTMQVPLAMEERAFQAFFDATAAGLRSYLARTSGDATLAEDLTQEAYVRLLSSDFEPESEAHRKNYLYRIATNLLRDHFRSRRRRREEPIEAHDPPVAPRERSARADLAQLFAGLRLRDRQILWLAYVEGQSHQEIADQLGLRAGSLRPMLFRARRRMAVLCRAAGLAPTRGSLPESCGENMETA